MDYLVTWSIDITADTPEAAAREAWRLMRGHGSTANVFDVFDGEAEPVHVDLTEIDEERAERLARMSGAAAEAAHEPA